MLEQGGFLQGEPAGILQLQTSNPQTGSLRLSHQVFLAAYGGDRVLPTSLVSALRLYLWRPQVSTVQWLHASVHSVEIVVYLIIGN